MRRLDELHLGYPLQQPDAAHFLNREGGPDRQAPRGEPDEAHRDRSHLSPSEHQQTRARPQDLPLLAAQAELKIERADQVWAMDITYLHPDGARLRLPGGGSSTCSSAGGFFAHRVSITMEAGLRHRSAGGGPGQAWQVGHLQQRPGQPVHQRVDHRRAAGSMASRSAWTAEGRLARQRVRRAPWRASNTRKIYLRATIASASSAARSVAISPFTIIGFAFQP